MRKKISKELADEYKALIWHEMNNENRRPSYIAKALGISLPILHSLMDGYKPSASTSLRITLAEVKHLREVAKQLHAQVAAQVAEIKRKWEQCNTCELLLGTMPVTVEESRAFQCLKDEILNMPAKSSTDDCKQISSAPGVDYTKESIYTRYPWGDESDAYLRAHYTAGASIGTIAQGLGISYSAVRRRAVKLGLIIKAYVDSKK